MCGTLYELHREREREGRGASASGILAIRIPPLRWVQFEGTGGITNSLQCGYVSGYAILPLILNSSAKRPTPWVMRASAGPCECDLSM